MSEKVRCCKCGASDDVRATREEGAYGPICRPFCRPCYEREDAAYRADMRRCGMRGSMRRWDRLDSADKSPWLDEVYDAR